MVQTLPLLLLQIASGPTPASGAALIAKAVEAFGGAAAVDAVTALELKGKGTRRVQEDDLTVTTLTRFYFPDRYYQELVLPMGTMKTVLSPSVAFLVAGEGSLPLPDAERQTLQKLVQRNVQLVDVTRPGDALTLAIDPVTGQVLQSRFESIGGLAPRGLLVVTYSDYRKAGPITYPFSAVATLAGRPANSQVLESVVVNPRLDEALFLPPPPHAMFPGADDPAPPATPSQAAPTPSPKPSPTPAPARPPNP